MTLKAGERYWVEEEAEASFPLAMTDGRSDRSIMVDLRIYWREKPTGELWAQVCYIDRETGKLINSMPLADASGLDWMLTDVIAQLGWAELERRAEQRRRTKARRKKRKVAA